MSQSEDSSADSSLECNSLIESDVEGKNSVASCFEPYQCEPLASTENSETSDEEEDEDYILPSVLEKRFEKNISMGNWWVLKLILVEFTFVSTRNFPDICNIYIEHCCRCSCGNCADQNLISAREYRCCKEIVEASGKFTWIGKDAECILNHPDFNAMTNETVLREVGPFLKNKKGSSYRLKMERIKSK